MDSVAIDEKERTLEEIKAAEVAPLPAGLDRAAWRDSMGDLFGKHIPSGIRRQDIGFCMVTFWVRLPDKWLEWCQAVDEMLQLRESARMFRDMQARAVEEMKRIRPATGVAP